mmetsp:Transcript_83102/g.269021  ORF Transcript_83102/g.269021 Transcript_83102/m.269021 type:complete len:209 (-) Transcript_83102:80-706(-)
MKAAWVLAALAAAGVDSASAAKASSLLLRRADHGKSQTTLELAGANCADPPTGLPKYCCDGIIPNFAYASSCECNPGWTHQECICKGHLNSMPCHECMVHLPATNRWLKSFKKSELYENCNACVGRCKTDLESGSCGSFMGDIWTKNFGASDPAEILCTEDYLKKQLMTKDYPTDMKRVLYKAPRTTADDEYHQPVGWDVAGVGGTPR